jgi:hypothetical protein
MDIFIDSSMLVRLKDPNISLRLLLKAWAPEQVDGLIRAED